MLENQSFYFSLLRKYTILFGATFDNIYIERATEDATKFQRIKVPIAYSPKDKMLARLDQDPDIARPYSALMPRMSFEIVGIEYDGQRKQVTTKFNAHPDATVPDMILKQYVGVPYNIRFNLYVAVKNTEDGAKIIEQILPFFTPDYTSSVELIPEMSVTHDIPIIRTGIGTEDRYDGSFENRRSLVWTLNFNMKAWFYGPIRKPAIIKFVQATFFNPVTVDDEHLVDAVGVTPPAERVNTQVTLTADGHPTSNAAMSINYRLVKITDDYGFSSYVQNLSSDEDYPNSNWDFQ